MPSQRKKKSTSQPLLDLDNSRLADQAKYMRQILATGQCPFCWDNLKKYQQEPVEWEGELWAITKNHWPYQFTKVHQLIIAKRHLENITQLTLAEWAELKQAINWVLERYKVSGGGVAIRFGDTNYSAGSVAHLHVHVIQPDIHHPDYHTKPVRVKIGKVLRDLANGQR